MAITLSGNASKRARVRNKITFRRFLLICVSYFGQDSTSSLDLNVNGTVEAMAEVCDTGLRRIVDHHAPLRETIVTMRTDSPRYTDELPREKHDRRLIERTRLRPALEAHQ